MTLGLQLTLSEKIIFFGILRRSSSILLLRVEGSVVFIERDLGLCCSRLHTEPKKYFTQLYPDGDLFHRVDVARITDREIFFARRTYSGTVITTDPHKMWSPVKDFDMKILMFGEVEENDVRRAKFSSAG